jgi:hypothetical protein
MNKFLFPLKINDFLSQKLTKNTKRKWSQVKERREKRRYNEKAKTAISKTNS